MFHGRVSTPACIFVAVGAAKCRFRCARVLCRILLSKCSFAEHIFTPRNASVKSIRGAKPAHAAGKTKSLTPVLQSPNENSVRGKKPTIFPGQVGWWQCTEMVQDEALFLHTGNSSPSCAMWEWVYPGEDFSSPGESDTTPSGCWHSIICQCVHSEELCDSGKGVTRAPLCYWHRLQGVSGGAACLQVDMGSKTEIQRGTKTFMLR